MTSTGGRLFSKAKAKNLHILFYECQKEKPRGGVNSDLKLKNI